MAQDCPNCRLINPDTAQRCDCGYDFATRTMKGSYLTQGELRSLSTLTSTDTAICVFLPVVGLIMGAIRWRQRRPTARRMLLLSGSMLVVWIALRVVIWSATR